MTTQTTKRVRGNWCETCQTTHPMSKARYAVASTCQGCNVETTDIHLVSYQTEHEGKPTIGMLLVCTPCINRGVTIPLESLNP